MTSYIHHYNAFESGTISFSNEQPEYEARNAYDRRTSTWWKPGVAGTQWIQLSSSGTATVDALGLMGHNLGTQGVTVTLQSSLDAITWTDMGSLTPANNRAIFQRFATQTKPYFRLQLTNCSVDTVIAVASIGHALALPSEVEPGFKPAPLNRKNKLMNQQSEGGLDLGRVVLSVGNATEIKQSYVTREWVDANWESLIDRLEVSGFFYSWDYEKQPQDAAYCLAERVTPPYYDKPMFMKFSIKCTALVQ